MCRCYTNYELDWNIDLTKQRVAMSPYGGPVGKLPSTQRQRAWGVIAVRFLYSFLEGDSLYTCVCVCLCFSVNKWFMLVETLRQVQEK